jgi:hypothetical protein
MISPSDLPWWGWLLCSLGAWVVCVVTSLITDELESKGCLSTFIVAVAGLIGAATGVMGFILFVKWVWTS